MGPAGKAYSVQFQSKSGLFGCLVALVGLGIGMVLAVTAGVVALLAPLGLVIWRAVRWVLPQPEPGIQTPNHEPSASAGVIDVESVVLPPSHEKSQATSPQPDL